jgi:hypothetical protein
VGSSIEGARERMDDIFFVLSSQRENRNQRQFGSTDRHERKRNLRKKCWYSQSPRQPKEFALFYSVLKFRVFMKYLVFGRILASQKGSLLDGPGLLEMGSCRHVQRCFG